MRKLPPEQLPFTQDEYRKARDASALEYAQSQGYNLIKMSSKYFRLKEHDSMIFTNDGWWFWNSQELKGKATEFITQYEKKSFVEAVLILNGKSLSNSYTPPIITKNTNKENENTNPVQNDEQGFVLPEKADNNDRVKAYLIKTRKLDAEIINRLMREEKIYEEKHNHNAVFVNFNESHIPQSAYMRGTYSYGKTQFKGEVKGSNNDYPFFISGKNTIANTINVYEASIDAISHASIEKAMGNDYRNIHRIALGGIQKDRGLKTILDFLNKDRNSNEKKIQYINFCFDNDTPGQQATKKLAQKYKDLGYKCTVIKPKNKDFNDDLIAYKDIILKREPVYKNDFAYAQSHNEIDRYRNDIQANRLCAETLKKEIADNLVDNKLNIISAINHVTYEFLPERIKCVVAYNVLQYYLNGGENIDKENIEWVKNTLRKSNIQEIDKKMGNISICSHAGLLNILANRLKENETSQHSKPEQQNNNNHRQEDEYDLER